MLQFRSSLERRLKSPRASRASSAGDASARSTKVTQRPRLTPPALTYYLEVDCLHVSRHFLANGQKLAFAQRTRTSLLQEFYILLRQWPLSKAVFANQVAP